VLQALWQMKKIDIARLQQAAARRKRRTARRSATSLCGSPSDARKNQRLTAWPLIC
jgi:hypothetical protein